MSAPPFAGIAPGGGRMFGSIGMPELVIALVVLVGVPLFVAYRVGYNSGYRKGLEKALNERRAE
jgi:hypothetical protein